MATAALLHKASGAAATAGTAVAIPAIALTPAEIVYLVALPLCAAFVGLVGVGVIENRPSRAILRDFVGSLMLGGVAGIVALAAINLTGVRGELAMFVTLCVGMGVLSISRKLKRVGSGALDVVLGQLGLQRKGQNDET